MPNYSSLTKISDLTEKHRAIARWLAAGLTVSQTAKKAAVSPNTVTRLKAAPAFRKYLDGLGEQLDDAARDLQSELRDGAHAALDFIHSVVTGETEASTTVRLAACEAWLDRAGLTKQSRIQHDHRHQHTLYPNKASVQGIIEAAKQVRPELFGDISDAELSVEALPEPASTPAH